MSNYSGECGVEVDHLTRETYRDDELVQWECTNCGAEGWEDLDGESDD